MILRAIFWIGVVAVLMPHEPDLGLGRPSMPLLSVLHEKTGSSLRAPAEFCEAHKTACTDGFAALDGFQSFAVHSLAQVRAEIEESRRARSLDPRSGQFRL